MGAQIGKLRVFFRTPTAVFKDVDKVLEQKTPAKRHPSTVKSYEDLIKNNPQVQSVVTEKDDNLHKMLETVKVDSTGMAPTLNLRSGKKVRRLNIRPEGKLTVNQVDELFINAKVSPEVWTVEKIALDYKLNNAISSNLLTYYSSFRIYKQPGQEDDEKPQLFFQKDKEKQEGEL